MPAPPGAGQDAQAGPAVALRPCRNRPERGAGHVPDVADGSWLGPLARRGVVPVVACVAERGQVVEILVPAALVRPVVDLEPVRAIADAAPVTVTLEDGSAEGGPLGGGQIQLVGHGRELLGAVGGDHVGPVASTAGSSSWYHQRRQMPAA